MLETNGVGCVWVNQGVQNINLFLAQLRERLQDCFVQKNNQDISLVSENRLYKQIKGGFCYKKYLADIKEKYLRVSISKIRLGSHNFMIERGRWHSPKIPYAQRFCTCCNVVEDEYHDLLNCDKFKALRDRYFPKRLLIKPSMFKFVNFLQSFCDKEGKLFSVYCYKVIQEYQKTI